MNKREYIQANKDWLEAKSKEEGVKALPKGIYYKVLAEGNASSAQPTVRSIITAHYTGKTIDGKPLDSSRQEWKRTGSTFSVCSPICFSIHTISYQRLNL